MSEEATDSGRTPGAFRSMEAIKRANTDSGGFYFSKDAMRFFQSRVSDSLYGGCLFVTSECDGRRPRGYAIRIAHADGSISSVTDVLHYGRRERAHMDAANIGRAMAELDGCPCQYHRDGTPIGDHVNALLRPYAPADV
jgi:hypothetical protein